MAVAASLVAPAVAAVQPAAASAAPAGVAGCQPWDVAPVYSYWGDDGRLKEWSKNCSGRYSLNSRGPQFKANGWSGNVDLVDAVDVPYCDGEVWQLDNALVREIYMSPTRMDFCDNPADPRRVEARRRYAYQPAPQTAE